MKWLVMSTKCPGFTERHWLRLITTSALLWKSLNMCFMKSRPCERGSHGLDAKPDADWAEQRGTHVFCTHQKSGGEGGEEGGRFTSLPSCLMVPTWCIISVSLNVRVAGQIDCGGILFCMSGGCKTPPCARRSSTDRPEPQEKKRGQGRSLLFFYVIINILFSVNSAVNSVIHDEVCHPQLPAPSNSRPPKHTHKFAPQSNFSAHLSLLMESIKRRSKWWLITVWSNKLGWIRYACSMMQGQLINPRWASLAYNTEHYIAWTSLRFPPTHSHILLAATSLAWRGIKKDTSVYTEKPCFKLEQTPLCIRPGQQLSLTVLWEDKQTLSPWEECFQR